MHLILEHSGWCFKICRCDLLKKSAWESDHLEQIVRRHWHSWAWINLFSMNPMRILAKSDDRIKLDPVNGTSLHLCLLKLFHLLLTSLYLIMYGYPKFHRPEMENIFINKFIKAHKSFIFPYQVNKQIELFLMVPRIELGVLKMLNSLCHFNYSPSA